ncbi:MAG TPA: DUF2149 domain-containing protein [Solirubrobacterales bacterium]|jgi:hypothetical protein|nr:DUF2149 domain-containing protein [Solirubrobacterales bacterium]
MSRIGLGRHRQIEADAGDPLDGLVNLFDVGMILAVAFLIAGLGLTLNVKGDKLEARHGAAARAPAGAGKESVIHNPTSAPHAAGRGTPVGQVYRLPDGRLVYVRSGKPRH